MSMSCLRGSASQQELASASRRSFLEQVLGAAAVITAVTQPLPANAIGFTKDMSKSRARRGQAGLGGQDESQVKKTSDFQWLGEPHDGLSYVDLEVGRGSELKRGDTAVVHYDCRYRSVVLASSRLGQLLGGNRSIAQPFELVYGVVPNKFSAKPKREKVVGVGLELRPAVVSSEESEVPLALGTEAGSAEMAAAAEAAKQPLEVVRSLPGSPAERGGVFPGERLLSIDGESTAGLHIYQAARLLAGEEGTNVTLEVVPKDGGPTRSVTVTRSPFDKGPATPSAAMDLTGGGGLFTGGEGASKPPPAIYASLEGMRVGGKRVIRITPDVGYGADPASVAPGELPAGATFEMEIELLDRKEA